MQEDKWDRRFMEMAELVSTWSKDPSTQIGAVIVDDSKRVVALGYNGFPSKIKDTRERLENREVKYSFTIHAEKNAILNAGKNGASTMDTTIYAYGLPICSACANDVIQAGIKRVVLDGLASDWDDRWKSSGKEAVYKFLEAKVEVKYLERKK